MSQHGVTCCVSCHAGAHWLRGSDCEVCTFEHEVMDLTQDGDDAGLHAQLNQSIPAEAK